MLYVLDLLLDLTSYRLYEPRRYPRLLRRPAVLKIFENFLLPFFPCPAGALPRLDAIGECLE